jgi:hypothetical protein
MAVLHFFFVAQPPNQYQIHHFADVGWNERFVRETLELLVHPKPPISAVVSMGGLNTQLEPNLH